MARRPGGRKETRKLKGLDLLLARSLYLGSRHLLAPLGEGDNAIAAAEEAKKIYNNVGDQVGRVQLFGIHRVRLHRTGRMGGSREALPTGAGGQSRNWEQNRARLPISARLLPHGRREETCNPAGNWMKKAFAIYREIGDKNREAWALTVLAWVVEAQDDLAAALRLEDKALSEFQPTWPTTREPLTPSTGRPSNSCFWETWPNPGKPASSHST